MEAEDNNILDNDDICENYDYDDDDDHQSLHPCSSQLSGFMMMIMMIMIIIAMIILTIPMMNLMMTITSLFLVASLFFSALWLAEEKSSSLSVRFWISRPGLHHDDDDGDDDDDDDNDNRLCDDICVHDISISLRWTQIYI